LTAIFWQKALIASLGVWREPKKPKREKPENSSETGEETGKAKPKKKEPKKPKIATFPCESFVNKYHFMRVGPDVLRALGWEITGKRLPVQLDLKDGKLIVEKPSK